MGKNKGFCHHCDYNTCYSRSVHTCKHLKEQCKSKHNREQNKIKKEIEKGLTNE